MKFNPRWIVGKTVQSVIMRAFDDGRGTTAHDPIITFTDGSRVRFVVEETNVGAYGVDISYQSAERKRGAVSRSAPAQ